MSSSDWDSLGHAQKESFKAEQVTLREFRQQPAKGFWIMFLDLSASVPPKSYFSGLHSLLGPALRLSSTQRSD